MALESVEEHGGSPVPSPPFTRGSSPSPSTSPTPALLACPSLDRSFSTTSSTSIFSTPSTTSRSSSGSAGPRRRGYVRPQGATFAESARNRDSVMSLGSIAHLQYYFARTGMLDGRGGQMAKEPRKDSLNPRVSISTPDESLRSSNSGYSGEESTNSPIDEEDEPSGWDELMLPPTVSTYSHRTQYIPPPPDAMTLRKELNDTLVHVKQTIAEVRAHLSDAQEYLEEVSSNHGQEHITPKSRNKHLQSISHGWYEIQGMHMLDVVTLAIRSAKLYYTGHEHPQRLAIIKSERQIREELLSVLDALKRMAARKFDGGIKEEELLVIDAWVRGVDDFLIKEQAIDEQEAKDRESWQWLEGGWGENDRKREWLFMNTFIDDGELPEWIAPSAADQLPTSFLEKLRSGLILVRLHNRILKKSKRQFGEIKAFHLDTALPYRAAENLRYWIKASEIRWEKKLKIDVMGLVYGRGDEVWRSFDAAILEWCRTVREEITKEWKQGTVQVQSALPTRA